LGEEDREISMNYETPIAMESIMTPSSMEVDPNKMDDSADAAVNQLQLMLISQKLFGAITRSIDSMPNQLRILYQHVRNEVQRKFADYVYKSVAGFLFLRFICPAVLAPHVYGLLPEPPNQECQRYLILLSKTLQNLALGTLPGKREDYMQKMDDFITTNQEGLKDFIEEVTNNVPPEMEPPAELPRGLKENALAFLHQHIVANSGFLSKFCDEQPNGKEMKQRITSVLQKLGPPLSAKWT